VNPTRGLCFPLTARDLVSGGLDHRAQAPGADIPALGHAVDDEHSGLDVRFEHAVRPPLGEAHIVAKLGRLATDLTLAGHVENPSALLALKGTWTMLRSQREP
jgi:hypothetical protein